MLRIAHGVCVTELLLIHDLSGEIRKMTRPHQVREGESSCWYTKVSMKSHSHNGRGAHHESARGDFALGNLRWCRNFFLASAHATLGQGLLRRMGFLGASPRSLPRPEPALTNIARHRMWPRRHLSSHDGTLHARTQSWTHFVAGWTISINSKSPSTFWRRTEF
jgi:hypothetical protein